MQISHEIPKSLFPIDKLISDYPYVLGHLIALDKQYKEHYVARLKEAPFSILDNSAFELGKSIDPIELLKVAEELRPTHLILPDTLHDMNETLKNSLDFWNTHRTKLEELNITPIGVLQGNSFEELAECFTTYIDQGVGYIAIPFDCIKDSDWAIIRFMFFNFLCNTGLVHMAANIHFLGIQNPQELLLYSPEQKTYITSIDTSSPIIHGWSGNRFETFGCFQPKPKIKLADNLDEELKSHQIELISHNVKTFRNYANR